MAWGVLAVQARQLQMLFTHAKSQDVCTCTRRPVQLSQLQTWSQRNTVKSLEMPRWPRSISGFCYSRQQSESYSHSPATAVFAALPAGSLAWEVRSERCSGNIGKSSALRAGGKGARLASLLPSSASETAGLGGAQAGTQMMQIALL